MGPHTPPDVPLPQPRRLFLQLVRVYLLASLVASAGAVALYFNSWLLEPEQEGWAVRVTVPGALLAMLVADLAVMAWQFRPLGRWLAIVQRNPDESGTVEARAARLRALDLPALSALRVMLVHAPTVAVTGTLLGLLGERVANLDMHPLQYVATALLVALVGIIHAAFELFAVAAVLRPHLPALHAAAGPMAPDEVNRLIPVRMRAKLVLVSTVVVLVPLFLLAMTVLLRLEAVAKRGGLQAGELLGFVVTLALSVGGLAVLVALEMARDVARPTQALVGAMQRVRDGDLGAWLWVESRDEFAALADGFNQMTDGLRQRERLRVAFGRYVAPSIADQVATEGATLGGQTVLASVLFADIRDFTSLSERLPPGRVVDLLNRYFAAVEPAIREQGGWINKFGGDSLLAVFGAPVPMQDHARRAVRAALGMRRALADFNTAQRAAGEPELVIGIGVHTGELVAGNVGSPERMEYTVIGDNVNVAARLQDATKRLGVDVLVSADVVAAGRLQRAVRELPAVELKGKSAPMQVFAVIDDTVAAQRHVASGVIDVG